MPCATARQTDEPASTLNMPEENTDKLQKILAQLGYGSRREMEKWIQAGRVSVNGKIASLGDRVGLDDLIRVDGHRHANPNRNPVRPRVILYHKPEGEVTSRNDPEGRPTVFEHLPHIGRGRWIAIGRLDINTAGLLLFTNNGELANALMHPSSEVDREYAVRVFGDVPRETLDTLREGVELEDGRAHFDMIREAGGEGRNHWYHVIIKEGRNREVRRLWESQGITVSRLHRVRYGTARLPRDLRPGRWVEMEYREVADLMQAAGLKPPPAQSRFKQELQNPATPYKRRSKVPKKGRKLPRRRS